MGLFDIFKKKDQTVEAQYQSEVDAEFKRMEKVRKARGTREAQVLECRTVMQECRASFEQSIRTERSIAMKKKREMIPADREKMRIREAAIGILVTESALLDLESISSEMDLNMAMNQMGKALKQLVKLDNSAETIGSRSRKFIDMFYPGFRSLIEGTEQYTFAKQAKVELEKGEEQNIASMYEIPKELRDRIDDTFVENLMAGDSFQMAKFKSFNKDVKKETRLAADLELPDDDRASFMSRIDALANESTLEGVDLYDLPGDI